MSDGTAGDTTCEWTMPQTILVGIIDVEHRPQLLVGIDEVPIGRGRGIGERQEAGRRCRRPRPERCRRSGRRPRSGVPRGDQSMTSSSSDRGMVAVAERTADRPGASQSVRRSVTRVGGALPVADDSAPAHRRPVAAGSDRLGDRTGRRRSPQAEPLDLVLVGVQVARPDVLREVLPAAVREQHHDGAAGPWTRPPAARPRWRRPTRRPRRCPPAPSAPAAPRSTPRC